MTLSRRDAAFTTVVTPEVVFTKTEVNTNDPYASNDLAPGRLRLYGKDFNPPSDPNLASAKLWFSDGAQWLSAGTGATTDADLVSNVSDLTVYVASGGSDANTVSDKGEGAWDNVDNPVQSIERALQIVREFGYNSTPEIVVVDGNTVNLSMANGGQVVDLGTGYRGTQSTPLAITGFGTSLGVSFTVASADQNKDLTANSVHIITNPGIFSDAPLTDCGRMLYFPDMAQPNKFIVSGNQDAVAAYLTTNAPNNNFWNQTGYEVVRNGTVVVNERVKFVGAKNVLIKNLNFNITNSRAYVAQNEANTASMFGMSGCQIRFNNISIVNTSTTQPLYIGIIDSQFYNFSSADYDGVGLDVAGLFIDAFNGQPGTDNTVVPIPVSSVPRTVLQVVNSSVLASGVMMRGYVDVSFTNSYVNLNGATLINTLRFTALDSTLDLNNLYFGYSYPGYWNSSAYVVDGNMINMYRCRVTGADVAAENIGGQISGYLDAEVVKFELCTIDFQALNIRDTKFTKTNNDDTISVQHLVLDGCRGTLGYPQEDEAMACYVIPSNSTPERAVGVSIANSDISISLNLGEMSVVNSCSPMVVDSSTLNIPDYIYIYSINSLSQAFTGIKMTNTRYYSDNGNIYIDNLTCSDTNMDPNIIGLTFENCKGVITIQLYGIGLDNGTARGTGAILSKNSAHHGVWYNDGGPSNCAYKGVVLTSGARLTGTQGSTLGTGSNALTVGSLSPSTWGGFVIDISGSDSTGCFASNT